MAKRKCLKRAKTKAKCLKWASLAKKSKKRKGKKCKFGVNKKTGACLKHKRAKKK